MRLLITYEYFLPAFKAGGPIQSIRNIAALVSSPVIDTYILCSDKDLDGTELEVEKDQWINFSDSVKVYYKSAQSSWSGVFNIIHDIDPDVIFVNGLYSIPYTIMPLLYKGKARKIVSARGMLHPGALSQKTTKKKVFLGLFKMLGLHKKCEFHSTTEDETGYINQIFGGRQKVWCITNLPNVQEYQQPIAKNTGAVKLVSISLISPMKNILCVLQALMNVKQSVVYDIYGPVKDAEYWADCQKMIKKLPGNINVNHKGELNPIKIPEALSGYHYFILPSKSENFGHAIYEALSAGKPVVTSHNTPWNNLEEAGAGYNINPDNTIELTETIEQLGRVDDKTYTQSTINAKEYITAQYNLEKIKEQYKYMFSA